MKKCMCGCGQIVKVGNVFINGHNSRYHNGFKDRKHSEKTKQKISEARKNSPPMSDETKKKISEAGKGRKVSEVTRKKISITKRREKHHNWKGGVMIDSSGRIFIRQMQGGYKAQARIIIEKKLKRVLKSNELVHHINGDPSDDRIDNLIVLTRSKHISTHNKGRIYSLETRRKIGEKSKGRIFNAEARKKISEASKKMWEKRRRKNEN
jgi:uncharacterized Zn finger protein (UPF0148 family)